MYKHNTLAIFRCIPGTYFRSENVTPLLYTHTHVRMLSPLEDRQNKHGCSFTF